MCFLQVAIVGGPVLIMAALVGFSILGLLFYFLFKSTRDDLGPVMKENRWKDTERRQVKLDTVTILLFIVLVTITVLFVNWLCNFKFD